MYPSPRILAFAGSARRASHNKQLARVAARIAQDGDAEVTWVDLRDFDIPLYDADLEADHGLPAGLLRLRALFDAHDALIVASPEYNGFFSPLLKNTLDWLSRPYGSAPRHAVFAGKAVLMLCAAGGGSGGARGLAQLRVQFGHLQAHVHAHEFVLAHCAAAIDENGGLRNAEQRVALADIVLPFVDTLRRVQARAA
jgi:NAD(P)H-dependent FMN reductase